MEADIRAGWPSLVLLRRGVAIVATVAMFLLTLFWMGALRVDYGRRVGTMLTDPVSASKVTWASPRLN